MKLIVFGATGGTGRQVVAQALTAGHAVTAVARRPDALAIRHDRLAVLHGDVLHPTTLAQPLAGQDAVVSALGVRSRAPTTVFSAGVSNIMQAMEAAGVRRLICISAAGLDPGSGLLRTIAKSILYRMLRHSYDDMRRMEALVKDSGLEDDHPRADAHGRSAHGTVSDCHEQAPRARLVDRARRPGRLHRHAPRRPGLVPCAGRGRCGVAAADEQDVGLHDKEAYR